MGRTGREEGKLSFGGLWIRRGVVEEGSGREGAIEEGGEVERGRREGRRDGENSALRDCGFVEGIKREVGMIGGYGGRGGI